MSKSQSPSESSNATAVSVPKGVIPDEWAKLSQALHPLTEGIDDRYAFSNEPTPPQQIVEKYHSFNVSGGSRPSVLSYQVDANVGETLLTESELTPLYQYSHNETALTTAWKIADGTTALIRSTQDTTADGSDKDDIWMIPPLGETQLDLRWMTIHTLAKGDNISVSYCNKETVQSILSATRPEDCAGMEQVLYSQFTQQ